MAGSEQLLKEIEGDHRSGAVALTLKAGEAIQRRLSEAESPDQVRTDLPAFAQKLVNAQPAMASIRNLAREILETAPASDPPTIAALIDEFTQTLQESTGEIARRAVELIPESGHVATISRSSTVLETLKIARTRGKKPRVVCPESRPLNEGVAMAQELSRCRIEATLCADAMAPALVDECDLVLVGGDALAPQGLVNKVGTYAMALAAREAHVPVAALLGAQKLLERFHPGWIPTMDPDEIFADRNESGHLRVVNRYFELTPLALIRHIVTEQGVHSPREIKELIP